MTDYMRTPGSCGICGVMGHTRRTCLVARLRSEGGSDYTQQEEERVKAHLRQEFLESPLGIRWTRYQRALTERRERAMQRRREQTQLELQRNREASQRAQERHSAYRAERDRLDGIARHSFSARVAQQIISWATRAERHTRFREERDDEGITRERTAVSQDISHSFQQISSWVRRAERETRTQVPKSLSLKMVGDFHKNYTIETECAICYERTPSVGLPCKHTFCGECTVKFAKKSQNCPLCRSTFQEVHFCRNIEPEEFNKISAKLYL